MIVLLAIGGLAAAGAAAFALRKPHDAPADTGTHVPVTPTPPQSSTEAKQQPRAEQPSGDGKKGGGELGAGGVLAAAGVLAGELAGASAFTKDAKDVAVPVGIGVAAAAYLALQVGGITVVGVTGAVAVGAAAAGYLVIPIILVTTSIITIVDGIARAIRAGDWKRLTREVAALRAQGKYREAMVLFLTKSPEIPNISRVWPQPRPITHEGKPAPDSAWEDRDWWNAADPLGKPYPGFPGPPEPASAAEVAAHPECIPHSVTLTIEGRPFEQPIRPLLEKLTQDIRELRAWAIGPGKVPGERIVTQKGAGQLGTIVVVTEGERDVSKWPPYRDAQKNLGDWCNVISAAVPWIQPGAIPQPWVVPAIEREVNAKKTAAVAAAKSTAQTARVAKSLGVSTAVAAAVQAEAKSDASTARDEARSGSRTGTTVPPSSSAGEAGRETGSGGTRPRSTGGSTQ